MKSIDESVIEVIANSLLIGEAEVSREATLSTDLHADSLNAVELIMALEDRFGIEIPDEDAENLKTVQQVIDYVRDAVTLRPMPRP